MNGTTQSGRPRGRWRKAFLGLVASASLLGAGAGWAVPAAASSPTLSNLTVSPSSSFAGAPGVTWTFAFTAVNGLPAGTTLSTAAQGATFSTDAADYILQAAGSVVPTSLTPSPLGFQVTLTLDAPVPAGAAVTLEAFDVTNPPVPAGTSEVQQSISLQAANPQGALAAATSDVTFQAPSAPASGPTTSSSGTLAIDQAPLPPLPAASLPGSDSTSTNLVPYTLRFDDLGSNLQGTTPDDQQTLDTQVTSIGGNKVLTTISSSTYYLVNAAAVEIPVACTSNPGWVVACNVKVEDASGNQWPDLRVIDPSGGTVQSQLANATQQISLPQVTVNTPAQPTTSNVVPLSVVPTSLGALVGAPNYLSQSAWGPVVAPGGLTLVPMPDCPGGQQTASATLLIPLNGVSAHLQIVTTEIAVKLSGLMHDLAVEITQQEGLAAVGVFGDVFGSNLCNFDVYVGLFALATHPAYWAAVLNAGLAGSYDEVNSGATAPGGQNPPMNYVYAFVQYAATQPLDIAQLPVAEVQLNVMPYKILYQPPGDNSHSEFSLSQGNTSQTDFTVGHESSLTTAVGNQIGWNAGLSAEDVGSVSYEGTWEQTVTQASSTSTSQGQAEAWTSQEDQSWQSYNSANSNGLPQLDTPGTQPWLYDQFVLEVHPQFAIYDGSWCLDGGTDCGVNASGQQQGTPAQGSTDWTLLGAQPTQFDIRAGALLTCAQGQALPIPDTNPTETLSPSECLGLLRLDPFAAAGTQSLDPSSTSAAGAIGPLAIPVQNYNAGIPGEGTNGAYAIQLSSTQETTNSTTETSSFTSTIDASITNKVDVQADVGIPELVNVQAGISYENSISTGQSLTISYTQSQTSSTVVQQSASATLSDLLNPIETNIYLDTRWDTLMFQVPQPQVTGVSPSSGLASGGAVLQVTGQDLYGGPVLVQLCPAAGQSACTPAASSSVASPTSLTATTPPLPPGTYCVQVVDTAGPSACGAESQFSVVTAEQQAQQNGVTAPIVSTVSPASGPQGGGTVVTLTGANLSGVQQVWFGAADPQANPGLFQQAVATGATPTVAPAPFVVLGDDELVACAPQVADAGTVWISVYGTEGWSVVSPADAFAYTPGAGTACSPGALTAPPSAPAVTGVSPSSGSVTGGTTVTVSGSGFAAVPQTVACTTYGCPAGGQATLLLPPEVQFCTAGAAVCSQATNVQVLDADTLLVQAPPAETGSGTVDVEVLGPGGWSAPNPADRFSYTPLPPPAPSNPVFPCGYTIVYVGPFPIPYALPCPGPGSLALGATPAAAAAGLTPVQVTATLLDSAGHPMDHVPVLFTADGGQLSVDQAVYTDAGGMATATLTDPSPATVSVTAEVYGSPDLVDRTSVTFEPVPVVTGLSASSGPTAGGTQVTVSGSGFQGAQAVYFGGTAVTSFTVSQDGTSLTVASPPGLGTVDVRVANGAAMSGVVPADRFSYVLATQTLTVTAVRPASGPAAGGTAVEILGSGLTGATEVLFGGVPAPAFQVVADTQIDATAPPGTGTVAVAVVGPGGPSPATPQATFTYTTPVGPVTRTLSAGWNTLSAPFPLASDSGSLSQVLSDGGASVIVALTYACATPQEAATGACWHQVTGPLPGPMQGVFVELRAGSAPVTATLKPSSGVSPPPEYGLQPGWNLVGPSALTPAETDQAFLQGVAPAAVPILVDPNGSPVAVGDPATDLAHGVTDGYAYWLFAEGSGGTLVGQVPTGNANP